MARVLIPLPSQDYDPTEAAVSHRMIEAAGHEVCFATPDGAPGHADELMVTGEGLDPWARVPSLRRLKLLGLVLRADRAGRDAYRRMTDSPAFRSPARWEEVSLKDFDGLLLPGGHRARGMRSYLESIELQRIVIEAFEEKRPVAAICHGVLLAARSRTGGRSVLHGRKTTALTWAFEKNAWMAGRIGRFWDPDYYRTYLEAPGEPTGYMSVQAEVTRGLANEEDFLDVLPSDPLHFRKTSGLFRDTPEDSSPAFVVRDEHYLSARWPGDVHTFARRFAEILSGQ